VIGMLGNAARRRGARGGLMLAGAMSLLSASAFANGRYPNADMLIVDPGDPNHLVLRATFGTLVSNDQGQHWSWICEDAVGYTGLRDPAITVLADGSLLHAFLGNIVLSAAQGCSFAPVPFNPEGRFAIDVTLDPADPSHAWVLASGLLGRRQASLLEVSDSASPPRLVAEDFVPYTIEVARSRPQRIYVVGFNGRFESTLLVSDDRGESWQARPIALYSALPMYLSAVAPADPETLYVRVDDGTSDHLLVSRDGGLSFVEVLTIPTEMLGFALSPDGSQVAAGGPDVRLQVASTTDFSFAPAADIKSLRCLTWAETGLFACAQESLDNWTLARSTDDGQSFSPLWHVQDLVPLECDASTTTGSMCPRAWLEVSSQIGAELVPSDGPPPTQPVRGAERDGGCAVGARTSPRSLGLAALAALVGAGGAAWRRARRRGA
jgi:photosystem II stability/assembly factor-like uncharacterized protein